MSKNQKVTLAELEAGSIFKYGDTYAFKTEYRTDKGICESYIIGSGEMFWGQSSNPNELLVEPVDFDSMLRVYENNKHLEIILEEKITEILLLIDKAKQENKKSITVKVTKKNNLLKNIIKDLERRGYIVSTLDLVDKAFIGIRFQ